MSMDAAGSRAFAQADGAHTLRRDSIMAAPRELCSNDFIETIGANGLVVVDWWAPRAPCRLSMPMFQRMAAEHPAVTFAKVDTEKEPELALSFGIQTVPTLMLFRDGILLFQQPGLLAEEALRDLLYQALALDMEQLRHIILDDDIVMN
jgi:thioredoxin 1